MLRRSFLTAVLAVATLLSNAVLNKAAQAEEIKLPAKEKFHLYLLIGQSNMAGRGVLGKEKQSPPDRILTLNKANEWAPAIEPLHFDKPTIAGAGLGFSFAQEIAKVDPDVTIGVIPCAVGGTPLSRWQKDADLYTQAVERARIAMKSGTLKGILWHQGESDAGSKMLADSYGKRMSKMIGDLRSDLDSPSVPFIVGGLGEFLSVGTAEKPSYWKVVNAQLESIHELVPNSAFVNSTGLGHKGDSVHFDTEALREFGRRYAAALLKLNAPKK
ncbi:sialate O-acetylesterase [Planctomicrobium sp. SH527]|uniref:sialate O-acetylesterase n=1 Tax=Planctomicrobium sp. SH527 TaxID=3448123 RepID=UPI003F5C9625